MNGLFFVAGGFKIVYDLLLLPELSPGEAAGGDWGS